MSEDYSEYFDPEKDLDFDENDEQFPDHYDSEKEFDEILKPHVITLKRICQEYNIPMVMSFQYKHSGPKSNLCTITWLPESRTGLRIAKVAKSLLE